MGQHKHNPNCRLAKEGKLPPKPPIIGRREMERRFYAKAVEMMLGGLARAALRSNIEKEYEEDGFSRQLRRYEKP